MQTYGVPMFRFLISCGKVEGMNFKIVEDAVIEAASFNEAGEIAEKNYPDMQVSVTKIGRIHAHAVKDSLPLGSSS